MQFLKPSINLNFHTTKSPVPHLCRWQICDVPSNDYYLSYINLTKENLGLYLGHNHDRFLINFLNFILLKTFLKIQT